MMYWMKHQYRDRISQATRSRLLKDDLFSVRFRNYNVMQQSKSDECVIADKTFTWL